ncbi:MAG: DUF1190 domain-containing protein [Glaciecola sp.]|jgi:uncharacterized protein YgiB involved in biofilm formation
MEQQKRSASISLPRFRKWFAVKPVAVGVAAVLLSACGDDPLEANLYRTVDECTDDYPDFLNECSFAYREAVMEAERVAPKFSNEYDCEYEFGDDNCQFIQNRNGSFFMPFMAGFMLSRFLDDDIDIDLKKKKKKRYYSQPLFTSYSRRSNLRNKWFTADGQSYGGLHKRSTKVYASAYKPKPLVARTLSRGGFGKSVARSSGSRSFGG